MSRARPVAHRHGTFSFLYVCGKKLQYYRADILLSLIVNLCGKDYKPCYSIFLQGLSNRKRSPLKKENGIVVQSIDAPGASGESIVRWSGVQTVVEHGYRADIVLGSCEGCGG